MQNRSAFAGIEILPVRLLSPRSIPRAKLSKSQITLSTRTKIGTSMSLFPCRLVWDVVLKLEILNGISEVP